jgi:glycosyltransferase involved in cell wall biosynthesis
MADKVDIVHTWALGATRTLQTAARLNIPTVLERPNAHTRFAYEVVRKECERLSVALPANHEHAYKDDVLRREEEEYQLATQLLCPSEFTLQTFLDQGFSRSHLVRHFYGYDDKVYYPGAFSGTADRGLTMLFVGVCAVRKGLHFALEAWQRSTASQRGRFLIAGEFLPSYAEKLAPLLKSPGVQVLGHRNDIADLMRKSDILVLPSIEEGFGLVCTEAMASGCVPLVSDACTDLCQHGKNALVHRVGDVEALTHHISLLHENRSYLRQLRESGLQTAPGITWTAAGRALLNVYREIVTSNHSRESRDPVMT